ncbi:MAG TPA: hypothetical protein VG125_03715, partial [Pirellulales bacterium]|nr:hypothetical protein [Pirellulales bacterium]
MCATPSNPDRDSEELLEPFRNELDRCRRFFDAAAKQCIKRHPRLIPQDVQQFRERMLELHRGLLIKILVEVSQCDWQWTENEYRLARALFEHCWGRRLNRAELKEALKEVTVRAGELSW